MLLLSKREYKESTGNLIGMMCVLGFLSFHCFLKAFIQGHLNRFRDLLDFLGPKHLQCHVQGMYAEAHGGN